MTAPAAADAALAATLVERIRESARVKLALADDPEAATAVGRLLIETFRAGRKLILFGNGGSAADSQHIAAEFVGRFYLQRRALPAIALTVNTSALTGIGNDFGFAQVFERQVEALGESGDAVIGLSTTGNSENVVRGLRAAQSAGLVTVALVGADGGAMAAHADHLVRVPSTDTPRIQECHILLGHVWSELVEAALFTRASDAAAPAP